MCTITEPVEVGKPCLLMILFNVLSASSQKSADGLPAACSLQLDCLKEKKILSLTADSALVLSKVWASGPFVCMFYSFICCTQLPLCACSFEHATCTDVLVKGKPGSAVQLQGKGMIDFSIHHAGLNFLNKLNIYTCITVCHDVITP